MADQQIVFLPGLGADERLFVSQRPRFPSMVVPRWIEPRPGEKLHDYAVRMAATIEPRENMILGGVSMGGMVAQEIAQILKPRALVLIATCRHPSELASWIRPFVAMERLTPAFLVNNMKKFAEYGMPTMGVYEAAHKAVLLEIARDVPISFARWAAGAILEWRGAPAASCPVLRIHGRRDLMIRCPRHIPGIETECVRVPGAGHLLNLTHAEEVNNHISSWMGKLTQSATS